jgi:signal transduction histidine kinase
VAVLRSPPDVRLLGRDVPLALAITALLELGVVVSLTDDFPDDDDEVLPLPDWDGHLLLGAQALPLAVRRAAPVPVLGVVALASLAYSVLGYRPPPLPLGVLVALFTVAVSRRPLVAGVAAGAYSTALVAGFLSAAIPMDDDQIYVYLVSVAAASMVGYGIALGRARERLAEQHAAELAREQDRRTRAAVEREQARIARDVHDIVASDVSVIVAQAAAARRALHREPQAAAGTLSSIEAVGRDALDGLRRLMTLLRTENGHPGAGPQPGLERLPWLIGHLERAGLPVDLVVRGTPRPLPEGVELNAFRIVQEALTNSLKHAGPTRATVTLDYDEESLGVEVRDQGCARDPSSSSRGFGLISMRQRAAMVGGDIEAGPDVTGFRVSAHLPTGGGAR